MVNFCVYTSSFTSLQHSVSCPARCRLDVDVLLLLEYVSSLTQMFMYCDTAARIYNQTYAEKTHLS